VGGGSSAGEIGCSNTGKKTNYRCDLHRSGGGGQHFFHEAVITKQQPHFPADAETDTHSFHHRETPHSQPRQTSHPRIPPAHPPRADLLAPPIPEGCQSRAGGRSPAQTSGSRPPKTTHPGGMSETASAAGQVRCRSPVLASLRDAAVRGAAARGAPSTPGALPDHRTATHGYDLSSLRDNTASAAGHPQWDRYAVGPPEGCQRQHPH
jgi:hypothetical protein